MFTLVFTILVRNSPRLFTTVQVIIHITENSRNSAFYDSEG